MVAVAVAPGGAEGGAAGLPAGADLKIADMMLPKILMVVLLSRLALGERPLSRKKTQPLTGTFRSRRVLAVLKGASGRELQLLSLNVAARNSRTAFTVAW